MYCPDNQEIKTLCFWSGYKSNWPSRFSSRWFCVTSIEDDVWKVHIFFSKIFIYYVFSIVFGKEPDLTREGGSIPVTLSLQNATETSVILLPMGASDDGAHSQNEKINVYNYINGVIFSLFISDTFYSRMSDKITNFGPKILYFLG